MKKSAPTFAKIAGVGCYAPSKVLTNADLEKIVDTNDEWIVSRTGIRRRHIAAENEYTSDMATAAARKALAMAQVDPAEVDAIFLGTSTADFTFPATACLVQENLGASRAYGYDISAACTGFLMALDSACAAVESGRVRTALAIGAEKLSTITDWSDRNTCVLFGDGAGAAVIRPSDRPGILSSVLGVDGAKGHLLCIPGGGSRFPACERSVAEHAHFVHMQGRETFKIAVQTLSRASLQAVEEAGLSLDQVDVLIPHQANLRIIEAVAERLGGKPVMDRVFLNLDRYGNTSAASIPIALAEAVEKGIVTPGKKVLMVAFGSGLSWGATVIEWR